MNIARHLARSINRVTATLHYASDAKEALEVARDFIIAASDDEKFSESNPDRLKILTDPDAAKLVQKLFQQYVSEDDFSTMVMFIKDFDSFLAKYRDRPLTQQEIDKIEKQQAEGDDADDDDDEEVKKPKAKKKKRAKSHDDLDAELPSEESDVPVEPKITGDEPEDIIEDEPSITISSIAKYIANQSKKR